MIASERRKYILEMLNNKGVISLKSTAKELGMAEITLRRDFEKLESEGKLKRVQGGATVPDDLDGAELTMSQKLPIHMNEKELVAKHAASLVKDGDCVFIDGGTTMLPFAKELMHKNVWIITNNTLLLKKSVNPKAQIFLVGGDYLPHYNMISGSMAQEMLKQFYFDSAFFSCSGLDMTHKIVYGTETESMFMKQIAMENAKKNYLLVDSSKFSKRGFLHVCNTNQFDAIFSDPFPAEEPLIDNLIMVPGE